MTIKEKIKQKNINWLISLLLNAVVLVGVLACTEMMYETNDDFGIAAKIDADYPYIGFVNYFLCKLLIAIQNLLPTMNIFVMSQLVCSFVALTVALKVLLDRSNHIAFDVLSVAVIALFSLDHYSAIQFTKTSGLLLAAGLLLLIDNYLHERKIRYFVLGYVLFYLGVMYRQKGMFPALAFATIVLAIWFLTTKLGDIRKDGIKAKEVLLLVIFMVLALVPYGLDKMSDAANASTPELKYAREYQAERVKITDYPVYDFYEENKDEYDKIGLSENDVYLVTHWMLDYDGAASLENLKKINEINKDSIAASHSVSKAVKTFCRKTYKDIRTLGFKGKHIVLLALISLWIIWGVTSWCKYLN